MKRQLPGGTPFHDLFQNLSSFRNDLYDLLLYGVYLCLACVVMLWFLYIALCLYLYVCNYVWNGRAALAEFQSLNK